jgi:hypothetical protein
MRPLFKTVLLSLLVYGCNNPAPLDTGVKEPKPAMKDSVGIKKDAIKPMVAKEDTAPLPPEHYKVKGPELGFELMDSEKIGDLRIGLTKKQVIYLFGQPETKSDTTIDQVNGELNQEWDYKKKGIIVWMEGDDYAKLAISAYTIAAPFMGKTKRRIGIGSTAEEIRKAYPKALDREESKGKWIVLGSVYGGIEFTMHNNKADTIFVGASAE